ncbi:beta/gamma crystallin-related protein [Paenibacillus caseinilyticus]|uniref:beta/gamma crystallin-related protein n=1 Tax=Paenibacillus mucilaginosus TaxID=61624 RepID=UPI0009DBAA4A|nr:beta/gamma crystallin-related protein [Paenibacillus mucilaginosus]
MIALSVGMLNVTPIAKETAHAATASACDGSPGVYIYEHDNYSGACQRLGMGEYPDIRTIGMNADTASSIRIVQDPYSYYQYEVTVFEHINYGGAFGDYVFDSESMGKDPIGNDRLSSLKIRPRSGTLDGIYLFEHAGWHGQWMKVDTSKVSLFSMNRRTSSIRIVGQYSGRFFTHENYGGFWTHIDHTNWTTKGNNLDKQYYDTHPGLKVNDSISSVQVNP